MSDHSYSLLFSHCGNTNASVVRALTELEPELAFRPLVATAIRFATCSLRRLTTRDMLITAYSHLEPYLFGFNLPAQLFGRSQPPVFVQLFATHVLYAALAILGDAASAEWDTITHVIGLDSFGMMHE